PNNRCVLFQICSIFPRGEDALPHRREVKDLIRNGQRGLNRRDGGLSHIRRIKHQDQGVPTAAVPAWPPAHSVVAIVASRVSSSAAAAAGKPCARSQAAANPTRPSVSRRVSIMA